MTTRLDADLLPEGARVQRVDVHDAARGPVVLELFGPGPGEKRWLRVDVGPRATAVLLDARPGRLDEGAVPAIQKAFREELVGARVVAMATLAEDAGASGVVLEHKGGKRRSLYLETPRLDARAVVCAVKSDKERVLAQIGNKRAVDGRDLRKGRVYAPPVAGDEAEPAPSEPGGDGSVAPTLPGPDVVAPPSDEERRRREALARLKAAAKRTRRLIARLEQDASKHGDGEALAQQGELLKTVLGQVVRGMRTVVAADETGRDVVIDLDEKLDGPSNLERLFHRARRAKEAARRIGPRLADARARLARLDAIRGALQRADVGEPLQAAHASAAALLDEGRTSGSARRRAAIAASRSAQRLPFRAFRCAGDVVVKVGRSAKDSDQLTFHIAKGNHTWMHARDLTGAHVVIPRPLPSLSHELLLDAAHLAAHFSKGKGHDRVDVQYAARKDVRKPGRGAPAGLVHISNERVLHLVVEAARLERLLADEVVG